ncbi:OLC1v1029654C1 [Oldenlandia corymbosa var. corymbosa]|nr:OLC1v1029654C1 [Oldenlandia corymbosa var. corymbosa]
MFSTMEASGLCRSSQLKVVDLSYNFFTGLLPKCLEHFPRVSFQGNCLDDKVPKQRPTGQCVTGGAPTSNGRQVVSNSHHAVEDPKHHTSSPKPSWLLPLEIVTGVMVGTLVLGIIISALHKWKKKPFIINPWKRSASDRGYSTICVDPEILKGVARFNRQELEVACEDFSNIIGSSPDSLVYKGNIKGGPEIAVISLCVAEEHWTGYLEFYFQKEVADLSRLNHENTGKLLGYCRESSPFTRMLVFEYASNGTLYEHLHYGEGCQLSWTRRMRIVIGIAKGLKYLHTELNPPFTISELNSSAVYLTDDFSPKLVDFESWKSILSRSEKNSGSISSEGAICVLPNAMEARHLDIQGNIYAFGILILEIVSGRPPYSEDKGYLVDWAKEYLQVPESMSSVVDPELKHFKLEDLKVICEVVNICIQASSHSISSMQDLCARLESGIDTSVTAELRASSLAWAELALAS